jgi:hypothetical protein
MKLIWILTNIAYLLLAVWGGYRSMSPERLAHTNPEPILCGILLIVMPVFALWTVYYSIQRSRTNVVMPYALPRPFTLRRPSWQRNPANWWGDPLQSLFVTTCFIVGVLFGAALRRPGPAIGSVGFWTLGVYCSLAIGLLIGQLLVYRVYRRYLD